MIITYSKANFLTKEQVTKSKKHHFVTLEEHEKLWRAKELWKRKYFELKGVEE